MYVVTREWHCDLDRKAPTCWYTLYFSESKEKAEKFMSQIDMRLEGYNELYLCKIPIEDEIDYISWEKYVISTRNRPKERDYIDYSSE